MTRRVLAALWCAVLLACAVSPAAAASRYDPRLRFRSIRTAHFTIYYHQGEQAQAQRLARVAEEVRTELEARLQIRAPGHTHVILADQTDSANGWSTPLPYNLVEITLAPPPPGSFLGQFDDWLRLVFTHEYTHTMHLDLVGGWMRAFRWTLGRHPLSFPNLFVPSWQIEGLATYAESAPGLGRVHAADVRAVIRAQAQADRMPRLDQLGGGLAAWPAGSGPYFYGGVFYDGLAREAGSAALGRLSEATSRRLPYFGSGAFEKVFGKSAAELWRAFDVPVRTVSAAPRPSAVPATRLTQSGYVSSSPRFAPRGESGETGPPEVFYSSATSHTFPALRRVRADGSGDARVVRRYLGNSLTFWHGWAVYDQLEINGPVAMYSDLWATDAPSGRTIRLTHGARIGDPDVSPDGSTIAAVASAGGTRTLVVLPVSRRADGRPQVGIVPITTLAQQGCSFATPRWSPDGRFIAAVVQCTGSLPDIVRFEPATGLWSLVAPHDRARDITPAWTPDGRWILFSSDRSGDDYRIYAASVAALAAAPLEVLVSEGGATSPDVSSDGASIVFVSATAGGLDVFLAPLPLLMVAPDTNGGVSADVTTLRPPDAGATPEPDAAAPQTDRAYSPWSTLWPRAWQPVSVVDGDRVDVGASVGGTDALGRHAYQLTATWPVSGPSPSPGLPSATRVDWQAAYSYDRWRPTFYVSVSDQSDTVGVKVAGAPGTITAESRTWELFTGVLLPVRRVRWNTTLLAGVSLNDQRIALASRELRRQRNGLRAGVGFSSAHEYGYSISREEGVRAGVTFERVTPALGADGQATTVTADARAYLPGGFSHAVLALRVAAGSSAGDVSARRVFAGGGTGTWPTTLSFDRRALGLLRGIDEDALGGTAIVSANADYRFPLVTIERGRGMWPVFVNVLHGAVFADYATSGDRLQALDRAAWSAGGELAADVTLGHALRLTLAAGAAWTHDNGRESNPGQASVFVRTGYAF